MASALTMYAAIRGLFGNQEDSSGNVERLANQLILKRQCRHVKPTLDAMAGDTTPELSFFIADRSYRIVSVEGVPSTAVTAGATNFATLLVAKRPASAPGTPVNVSTRSLAATNMVAFTKETHTLTATAADLLLVTGDVLTFAITKTMSGLAVPAHVISVNMVEV